MPDEVIFMILRFLKWSQLTNVNCVCRKLWRFASALLWNDVRGPDYSVIPPTRYKLLSYMTAALDLNKIHRFYAYAGFVHTLYLGSSVLPQVLRLVFLGRKDPLLPNLRHLFIGVSPHGVEWPDNTLMPNDVLELLSLFLSPSLHTLSLSCEGLAIHPDELFSRAPNINNMRLLSTAHLKFPPYTHPCFSQSGEHQPPCLKHPGCVPGVYAQHTPGQWANQMTFALSCWLNLATLTINGDFLSGEHAVRRVSTLPNLSVLVISVPLKYGWADLPSGDDVFPKLDRLTLDMATSIVAQTIFCCPAVSTRVFALDWSIIRRDTSAAVASCAETLKEISRVTPRARSLHIFDCDGTGARRSLWACNNLYDALRAFSPSRFYTECNMHALDTRPSVIYAFLALGSHLTYLSLIRLQVPAQLLELFAYAYPMLSYLRCTVDISTLSGKHVHKRLPRCVLDRLRVRPSVDVALVINFSRRRNPPNLPKETALGPKRMANYIRMIWPKSMLIEDEWRYEYAEASEYFRQVAELLD